MPSRAASSRMDGLDDFLHIFLGGGEQFLPGFGAFLRKRAITTGHQTFAGEIGAGNGNQVGLVN